MSFLDLYFAVKYANLFSPNSMENENSTKTDLKHRGTISSPVTSSFPSPAVRNVQEIRIDCVPTVKFPSVVAGKNQYIENKFKIDVPSNKKTVKLAGARRAFALVVQAFENASKKELVVYLSDLGTELHNLSPDFLYGAYGCSGLRDLVGRFPEFEVSFDKKIKGFVVVRAGSAVSQHPTAAVDEEKISPQPDSHSLDIQETPSDEPRPEDVACTKPVPHTIEIRNNFGINVRPSIENKNFNNKLESAREALPIILDAFEKATETNALKKKSKRTPVDLCQLGNSIHSTNPDFVPAVYGCSGLKDLVLNLPEFELHFDSKFNRTIVLLRKPVGAAAVEMQTQSHLSVEIVSKQEKKDPLVRKALPILVAAFQKSAQRRGAASLSHVGNNVLALDPTFLYGAYGCSGLKDMMEKLPEFELIILHNFILVRLTK